MTPLIKQPGEERVFDFDFAGLMAPGLTVASITSIVLTPAGQVAQVAALTNDPAIISGTIAQVKLKAGTDGEKYLATVTITDSAGEIAEAEGELLVLDLGFTAPADGAATTYIEPSEYIDRYGLDELIALTDVNGVGRIDLGALNAALGDAAAEIDANLAARYPVPLVPIPDLARIIAGDLARERLHGTSVPETVKDRATAARRQLERLASGRMTLPGATAAGVATPAAPSFNPAGNHPFSADALKDF